MNRLAQKLLLLVLAAGTAPPAAADLRVDATRVVHVTGADAPSIRLRNQGDRPSLVQTWVGESPGDVPLEEQRQPFVVTPPVFKLEAGNRRDITIRPADTRALPTDRETMFWLNVLDVMGSKADGTTQPLDVAVHWKLKLFHRPQGLPGSPRDAADGLHWQVEHSAAGAITLRARNSGPYHVSLAGVQLGGAAVAVTPDTSTIAPFAEWESSLHSGATPVGNRLEYRWIDDEGLEHVVTKDLPAGGS